MNGVFVATRMMKGHEVRRKCAEAKSSPTQMFVEDMRRKRKLSEMNRKVSARREVS
ncbi:hypothetical protein 7S4_23 [uncultured Caudovirales phage]|uniref:Uncharacterized protein n=1 Tax=uncultured Caudovirales phage TaxID=2100421 RepID=A0A2H4JAZ7_9CAUD|nr:hypothetical protein 7S4_23 [uncultured Caudovirales phage]